MKIFPFLLLLFISANRLSAQPGDADPVQIVYGITSPLELSTILFISTDHINTDSLLPLTPVDSTLSMQQKALLVGGYWCDASLFVVLQNGKEFMTRIPVLKNLYGQLHIPFSEDFENRANRNVTNTDSLAEILTELQFETQEYLADNDRKDLSMLMSIGGVLENLYVSARSFPAYKKEETQVLYDLTLTMKLIQEATAHRPVYSPASVLINKLRTLLPASAKDEKTVKANHDPLIISTREIRTLMLVK